MAASCESCGEVILGLCVTCPQCKAVINDEDLVMRYYFSRGFTYKSIVSLLLKRHGVRMCERTLRNRLNSSGLRRRESRFELTQVRQRIVQELNGPGCMGGYRSVWHTLRMEGLQVPRKVVADIVRELDPEGCELRKRKRLRRRQYYAPGPNYVWHLDGYDKLKPYGFPIHGCIDGWSRKIMWLHVTQSNNNPEIPAIFYLKCVEEHNGCPVKVRTDCGTENGIISAMQCCFHDSAEAHVYGRSPANQRIEGWWSFYRRNRSTWWINYFKDLVERELFTPGNQLQQEALWFCFSGVIQSDLDVIKDHWNTHRIRSSGFNTVSGVPDELFFLPENNGGQDGLIRNTSEQELQYIADNLLTFEDDLNDYQAYFAYIISNSDLQMPKDWQDAENLYMELIQIAL